MIEFECDHTRSCPVPNLDHAMFRMHPYGYLCRCGMVYSKKSESCTCPEDFNSLVIQDIAKQTKRAMERISILFGEEE